MSGFPTLHQSRREQAPGGMIAGAIERPRLKERFRRACQERSARESAPTGGFDNCMDIYDTPG